jgi:hypothetical protein
MMHNYEFLVLGGVVALGLGFARAATPVDGFPLACAGVNPSCLSVLRPAIPPLFARPESE